MTSQLCLVLATTESDFCQPTEQTTVSTPSYFKLAAESGVSAECIHISDQLGLKLCSSVLSQRSTEFIPTHIPQILEGVN